MAKALKAGYNMYTTLKRTMEELSEIRANDPLKICDVYKNECCSHVDGMLCDCRDCDILNDYRSKKNE